MKIISAKNEQRMNNDGTSDAYTFNRFGATFIGGYAGLSLAFAAMHPVDTLKTQMQAGQCHQSLTQVLRNASFHRQLGRGFLASVLGAGPQGGARLSTYELTKYHLLKRFGDKDSILAVVIAAVIGDFASSIVKVPREIVTSRLQTSKGSSTAAITREIYSGQGLTGFFRGFWSTTARDCPFMVILFGSYESMKLRSSYLPFVGDQQSLNMVISSLYGGISGGIAAFVTTPLDVIKTRIMTAAPCKQPAGNRGVSSEQIHTIEQTRRRAATSRSMTMSAGSSASNSMFEVSKSLYREGGTRMFFIGAIPRSAWWFCVCGIFFPTYETTKKYVLNNQ
jgi:solute carrier family 25 (mitochondrial S-adenosylmethionine transporter), member 26